MIELFYLYDKETLVVNQQGISTTRFSALPEYPRDALIVKPLEPKEGFVVCVCDFENGRPTATEYIADHRGKTIYNKEKPTEFKQVEKLGDVEEGWTLKQPPTSYHIFNAELDDWQLTAEASAKQLADTRKNAKATIDNVGAGITNYWTRFTVEYEVREAQAIAFKRANYEGECGSYITMFSARAGKTEQQATDIILQQAEDLRSLQEQLASQRMRKYELDACETVEEIEVLTADICTQMKALGESYE